ncbi:MAG: sigma-70 family RNA polymerase sigma factor [Geodermatophilaceae bacterium]|nr:sigma-70 family RNA polymerase sigma factor [Geodermatophilaceae bacterium]MDQ3454058.1 sigma-70 family RNA polymerase sigma factor [Actinomycetota bacterium]
MSPWFPSPPPVTDAELLKASAAGDDASFALLYRRNAGLIKGRLRRRCGDPELIDEVLQDTFLAVWRSAHRWNGSGEVQAWIWGIAVRRLADALRSHLGRPDLLPPVVEDRPSAEEELLRDVRYGDVGQALSRLAPDLQLVLRVTVEQQLTTREAAELLGIPQGTVKTRMMRARAVLRHSLT